MKTVCVSGGFDPITSAHIDHFEAAARLGSLTVIINSDDWLLRKKGYVFMPFEERKKIIMALGCVDSVSSVDDSDGTVCEALRRIKPDVYAKGGDRTSKNTPELELCGWMNIMACFGVGGIEKTQSSSWLVKNACIALNKGSKLVYPDGV